MFFKIESQGFVLAHAGTLLQAHRLARVHSQELGFAVEIKIVRGDLVTLNAIKAPQEGKSK
jgi:hypothetical protein